MTEQQNLIKEFLQQGCDEDMELIMQPIDDIKTDLEKLGFEMEKSDENTNGWQVDFFYYFNHSVYGKYLLHGSLWYGDFKLGKINEN